ncbi:OmpA family protein [Alkalimonas sp. MEB108]|uniref:OmpA family protein n=1 Tax=Alkalimonas cellulosilytica TaxID=3058395 RepID=A0ABU7J8B1_9GAMM|nr:OmpA family protein [Alkalimonas sp. MEB108]MEE2002759.1 OmpA family protein [Alkalimonas sp. MEB108]
MKRKICSVAVAVALPMMAGTAYANTPSAAELQERMFGSVFAEYYMPDRKKTRDVEWDYLTRGPGVGLELGYRFDENWAVRVEYARQRLKNKLTSDRVTGNRVGIDAMYHLTNSNLYLVGGYKHFDMHHSDALNVGIGYRAFLNENLAFYAEANRYQELRKSGFADAGLKAGLTYVFGSSSAPAPTPAPAPAPTQPAVVDSDGDGVPDHLDQCPNTPRGHKVDERGCTVYQEVEQRVGSAEIRVLFAFDSAEVSREQRADVARLADYLKRYPTATVEIEGHASRIGAADYNQRLSERRARAVADLLVNTHGIERSRISTVGYGFSRPRMEGATREAHRANQRIEALVTARIKEPVMR